MAVTSTQSLTPAISSRIALRTASVRGQMPALGSRTTTILNSSLTDPPIMPSLAVTFTVTVPTSAAAGVPEKRRVLSVKVSHVGSAMPSAFVAL